MRTRNVVVSTLVLLLAAALPVAAHASAEIYVLRLTSQGLRLDPVAIADGQTLTFTLGLESNVVDLVLPFSPGHSGNLTQREKGPAVLRVTRTGDTLIPRLTKADGTSRNLPEVSLAALQRYAIRVNVTGAREKAVFVIEDGAARRADGPVVDIFGGKIPIGPHDYAITTVVTEAAPRADVTGTAELFMLGGDLEGFLVARSRLANDTQGNFIIDAGATGSVIEKPALPPGVEVRPMTAIEVSDRGTREMPGTMSGAGGEVAGLLGSVTLPELRLGRIVFRDAETAVLERLPDLGGGRISGIIGQNLLRRAEHVSITLPEGPGATGVLTLGGPPADAPEAVELPFTEVHGHMFVSAKLGDRPLTFLLDTGARRSTVPRSCAEALGMELSDGEGVRGLDGTAVPTKNGVAPPLGLGAAIIEGLDVVVVDLPVLVQMGLGDSAGVLGMDVLRRFAGFEIDYPAKVLRLLPLR